MNKKSTSILIALLFTAHISLFSQQSTYPVKTINGVSYYLYNVQAGEGLFAIGRKFKVTPEEIVKANPGVENKMKAGLQLLVPVKKNEQTIAAGTATTNHSTNVVTTARPKFIEHTVDKKQTIFAICKKYNITSDELQKYNPELEYGLKDGMTLRIPVVGPATAATTKAVKETTETAKTKQEPTVNTENKNKKYILHEVQTQETLYSISRKYNVSVSELINLNPGADAKLTAGSELKIPTSETTATETRQSKTTKPSTDSTENSKSTTFDINKLFDNNILSKKKEQKEIHIAFLLPFMLDQDKKDAGTERFIEFYSGALLALEQAKAKGISFTVYTYDTDKSEERMDEILQNSELKTVDLIIGPAFSNQIPAVSDFAKANKIHTLIPFSSKVPDIETNPYLFQFNPGSDVELEHISKLLNDEGEDLNLVFAQIPGISTLDEGRNWSADLKSRLTANGRKFGTVQLSSPIASEFIKVMKPGAKNLVIFNTDKLAQVSPYLKALKEIPANYSPLLYQQYGWTSQNIQLPNGLYISPFMSKFNSRKLTQVNEDYGYFFGRSNNRATHLRYDLLGYDLTNYFVELISLNGKKYADKTDGFRFGDGVQSQPKFERTAKNGGFINKQLYTTED